MIRLFSIVFFGVSIILISSCEKNITLDLPMAGSKLVVEGYVYQDTFPYVILTKNAPFFSTLDSSALQQFVVRGAKIIVSDGITTDTMTEINLGQLTFYAALNNNLKGHVGRTYNLRIEANGQVVTASTFIPPRIQLDSTWWKVQGEHDSLGFAWAHLTDPDTIGNYYRWFAKRINHYPESG